MEPTVGRRAVHFGAGNIGRGFIGWMLVRSGYEVTFVSRNEKQIDLLQRRRQYTVYLANPAKDAVVVDNVRAVHVRNARAVEAQVAAADLVTTAVGASSLPDIAGVIARGIERRLTHSPKPLHVIACENAIDGSELLKRSVFSRLDEKYREAAERYVSFPNTIVDRIVPVQKHRDMLSVTVEPYYEWVIQRTALKKGFHDIRGVRYAQSLEPYMERKLFTVNTGHCSAAYFGYLAGHRTIQEAMRDPDVRARVSGVLRETSRLLVKKHGFGEAEQADYVAKTLERFENPALTDKIGRVGRSPLRKLSTSERLVRPALQAHRMGIDVPHLASAIGAAMRFDPLDDLEAVILQMAIRQRGAEHIVRRYMKISDAHPLFRKILRSYREGAPKQLALE